jgi:hypothetical protein
LKVLDLKRGVKPFNGEVHSTFETLVEVLWRKCKNSSESRLLAFDHGDRSLNVDVSLIYIWLKWEVGVIDLVK